MVYLKVHFRKTISFMCSCDYLTATLSVCMKSYNQHTSAPTSPAALSTLKWKVPVSQHHICHNSWHMDDVISSTDRLFLSFMCSFDITSKIRVFLCSLFVLNISYVEVRFTQKFTEEGFTFKVKNTNWLSKPLIPSGPTSLRAFWSKAVARSSS